MYVLLLYGTISFKLISDIRVADSIVPDSNPLRKFRLIYGQPMKKAG